MKVPIEIVAVILAFVLSTLFAFIRSWGKRLARLERSVLTVIVMLRDRGFRLPDQGDTERFARSNNLDGI